MNKIIVILIVILSFSCSKKENLDNDFRNILIDYQRKFPLPNLKNKDKKRIYVYSAYFWKNKKDTLLVLTRSSSGIMPNVKGLGIYEDGKLKPTFIVDENNLGGRFILKKIIKIDKKYYNNSDVFDEGFTPIYTYKISNKSIDLIKIDTIWKHWD